MSYEDDIKKKLFGHVDTNKNKKLFIKANSYKKKDVLKELNIRRV